LCTAVSIGVAYGIANARDPVESSPTEQSNSRNSFF
jgi:hypothetical protein